MNALTLKIIAIIAMTIDHLGYAIFPKILILRWIGRLTFPIMAFFIGEGYKKTSNLKKYITTLGVFALISEIPFNLLAMGKLFVPNHQNVLFTLALGLIAIMLYEKYKYNRWGIIAVLVPALAADLAHTDYGGAGVYLIFALWMFSERKNGILLCIGVWSAYNLLTYIAAIKFSNIYLAVTPLFPLMAVPLIKLYNGDKGYSGQNSFYKYIFYIYYPIHMLIISYFA